MDWLRHDLRHALRLFARRPAFAALAVGTLALGLGVNTVAFSAVNALVFKPFRFPGAAETGWLFVATARDPLNDSSVPVFEAIAARATALDRVAAEGRVPLAYDSGGATEEIWALMVSRSYFSIVQTTPLAGRVIGGTDAAGDDIPVLVSERFWRRRLGGDREIGRLTLTLNQRPAHVIGVLRDGYQGPGGVFEPDVWVPLEARRTLALPARYEEASAGWLTLIARPKAGVTAEAIRAEVAAIAQDAGLRPRDANDAVRVAYERFADGHPETRQMAGAAMLGLGAVGLVLLIACFNVAGLVLARSVERRRDLGIRAALGAGRWRLSRQIFTEGLVLAAAGGAAALFVASWSASLLGVFSLPAPIPQRLHFATDWRMLAYTAGIALVAAIVPALAPIRQVARADLARWLGTAGAAQSGGFGQRRARRAFVILQVAGSNFFLAAALMAGANFLKDWQVDPGFDADHLAVMEVDPSQYAYAPERARDLADALTSRLRNAPGVRAVSITDRVSFFVGAPNTRTISLDGQDCQVVDCPRAGVYVAGPSYFDAMGIDVVAGRPLDERDSAASGAVVISKTAADTFWPGQNAIGRSFRLQPEGDTVHVIGVAADVIHRMMTEPRQPYVYRPPAIDAYGGTFTIVARTSSDPAALLVPMQQTLHALDPRLPTKSVQTMANRMALPLWMPRTTAGFFGACGIAAALLSMIGLFGVTYFTVNQRRREFGVRFALGATRGDVRRLVMREALQIALPGMVVGLAIAVVVGVWLQSSVTRISTTDVAPFALAVLGQALVTLLASWSPASRAGRSNPLEVLRAE